MSATAAMPKSSYKIAHTELKGWVDQLREEFSPDEVYWCDGSKEEYDRLCQLLVDKGTFIRLNPEKRPSPC